MYIITVDRVNKKDEKLKRRIYGHSKKVEGLEGEAYKAKVKEICTHKFKLLDDDGHVYFFGFSTNDSSFAPMDGIGACYGCTEIHYKNKITGEYEIL